jgi:TolA-binding protein
MCGCQKKAPVKEPAPSEIPQEAAAEPAPPAITPDVPYSTVILSPAPSPSPKTTSTVINSFNLAEADFRAGEYQQAALAFASFLENNPESDIRDQAWYILGLSWALAGNSARNQRESEAAFKQLVAEFPESPYTDRAEYILDLKARINRLRAVVAERDETIKKLSEELNRLKEIDLQRKPTRPE